MYGLDGVAATAAAREAPSREGIAAGAPLARSAGRVGHHLRAERRAQGRSRAGRRCAGPCLHGEMQRGALPAQGHARGGARVDHAARGPIPHAAAAAPFGRGRGRGIDAGVTRLSSFQ